ncbi:ChaB1 [Ectropis obliqua nucleopolyhedrovirus]|uniref:ChaB1 n=1 Tax=Ectropis obliqua nucleopolyhedrovirus TaxID=59376 RepID=A0EYU6_9ABAC|nr:ChaB1 [Ectropis obliqua nucleopolyhedrovirus]ABI35727.1 ChaB1 [Ectropis obliqua nucleopolyhedrovirus]AGS47901.1 hypothetical protein wdlz-06GM55 [Ectropis obliqua nucleopolyhedrovirus]QWV59688.1 ChaB1 [Ectropis obliqua nucleopolyhedrovirus]UYO72841.1 ChaB1 [Ectropis obliqua nucleopolyhedrovirus]
MEYLTDIVFKEEMPARAKQLFKKTYLHYCKPHGGGDEIMALHMARRAVEKQYVKLNNRWYPKAAAEIIVKHDMDNDDNDDVINSNDYNNDYKNIKTKSLSKKYKSLGNSSTVLKRNKNYNYNSDDNNSFSENEHDEDNINTSNLTPIPKKIKMQIIQRKLDSLPDSSDDNDDDDDDNNNSDDENDNSIKYNRYTQRR